MPLRARGRGGLFGGGLAVGAGGLGKEGRVGVMLVVCVDDGGGGSRGRGS